MWSSEEFAEFRGLLQEIDSPHVQISEYRSNGQNGSWREVIRVAYGWDLDYFAEFERCHEGSGGGMVCRIIPHRNWDVRLHIPGLREICETYWAYSEKREREEEARSPYRVHIGTLKPGESATVSFSIPLSAD